MHACPKLLPLLIVGDKAPIVAQISSILAQKSSYLPIVDEPRINRPDADNEYVRRHNAAARVQANHIVFADVSDEIVSGMLSTTTAECVSATLDFSYLDSFGK